LRRKWCGLHERRRAIKCELLLEPGRRAFRGRTAVSSARGSKENTEMSTLIIGKHLNSKNQPAASVDTPERGENKKKNTRWVNPVVKEFLRHTKRAEKTDIGIKKRK